ncbi:hypothetical protein M5K25_002124 [Dendrobium thyrsiflorum]|uniref:Uncharacterized protein n=1 Tax=Dendrobium thyrsiflorum TaxID=117978 RepID=A0ABD0VSM6_DENTH
MSKITIRGSSVAKKGLQLMDLPPMDLQLGITRSQKVEASSSPSQVASGLERQKDNKQHDEH